MNHVENVLYIKIISWHYDITYLEDIKVRHCYVILWLPFFSVQHHLIFEERQVHLSRSGMPFE